MVDVLHIIDFPHQPAPVILLGAFHFSRLPLSHEKRMIPEGIILMFCLELLAEVALQQAFESLAVAGFVLRHFIKTCAKAWFCVQLSTTHLQL